MEAIYSSEQEECQRAAGKRESFPLYQSGCEWIVQCPDNNISPVLDNAAQIMSWKLKMTGEPCCLCVLNLEHPTGRWALNSGARFHA